MWDGWEIHLYMINPSLHNFGVWTVGYIKQFLSYISYVKGMATLSLESSPGHHLFLADKLKTKWILPTYLPIMNPPHLIFLGLQEIVHVKKKIMWAGPLTSSLEYGVYTHWWFFIRSLTCSLKKSIFSGWVLKKWTGFWTCQIHFGRVLSMIHLCFWLKK
jgi:hypothetical protein